MRQGRARVKGNRRRYPFELFLLVILFPTVLVTGCSLPRIIILKDPLTPEEHLNLGVAYERRGEFDLAVREYQKAARTLPRALVYLGNVHFLRNEWKEAEAYYRKAIEKDPGNADAHNNLAWLFYSKGENLEEAEALAQKALALDPTKEEIYKDTLEKVRKMRKNGS